MSEKIRTIIVEDEELARNLLKSFLKDQENIEVVAECENGFEGVKMINELKPDLVFLDINMPEISGLSFAKSINNSVKVIFTTAYREYAVDGFDLQAVDYLLKPISFGRLMQSINKYLSENQQVDFDEPARIEPEKSESIFVRSDRKMIKINFPEILYIESLADYIKIHLIDKTVVTRETISSIEAKLPQQDFLRVHRSFLVAVNAINSFTSEIIEIGKKQIPVSRSYKDAVLQKLQP